MTKINLVMVMGLKIENDRIDNFSLRARMISGSIMPVSVLAQFIRVGLKFKIKVRGSV